MKRVWILHPFLLAVFPVVFTFSMNMRQFPMSEMARPAAVTLGWTLAGWAALGLALRNARKAAIIASLFLVLFFSYGHVASLVPKASFSVGRLTVGTSNLLLAVLIFAFLSCAYAVATTTSDLAGFTKVLNFAAACLAAIPAAHIAIYETSPAARLAREERATQNEGPFTPAEVSASRPHIFYIILDGYARADNLKEIYGYDNSEFIDYLKGKGFYVAQRARTNYSHTFLSLASSLNMQYLDGLAAAVGQAYQKSDAAERRIAHSMVRTFLRERGYRFATFETGWQSSKIADSDLFLRAVKERSEFERGVMGTTPAASDADKSGDDRRRILYPLQKMPELAQSKEALFVFAHIIAPHPPYVFGRDGRPADISRYYAMASGNHLVQKNGITRAESMRRYVDQVIFLNSKMKETVDRIFANSSVPPIIVIQGDHGPGCFLHHSRLEDSYLQDRMSILNAYYLPGGADDLYDSVTPVNTFRVILNRYFGTRYRLLPDRNYYSAIEAPYKFIDVTDEIGSAADKARYEMLKGMDYFPG